MAALSPKYRLGQIVCDRYRLDGVIGRGAFATVYRARTRHHKLVAVKVLEDTSSASTLRFAREVKVLQSMPSSTSVAGYIDSGRTPDRHPALVMEFVDGNTLREAIARRDALHPVEAAAFTAKLCHAFTGLHELGVAHRDVKPDNILISRTGEIKLIDFGLIWDAQGLLRFMEDEREELTARRVFEEDIDTGILAGTLEYMAPEQLADSTVSSMKLARTDTATDVFSLGVILVELMKGSRPFDKRPLSRVRSREDVNLFIKWRVVQIEQALDQLRGVDDALMSILRKSLCAEPRLRQPDCRAFARELENYLETGLGVSIDDSRTQTVELDKFIAQVPTKILRSKSAQSRVAGRSQAPERNLLRGSNLGQSTNKLPHLELDDFDDDDAFDDAPTEVSQSHDDIGSLPFLEIDTVDVAAPTVVDEEGVTELRRESPPLKGTAQPVQKPRGPSDETASLELAAGPESSETNTLPRDHPPGAAALEFADSLDDDATTTLRYERRKKKSR